MTTTTDTEALACQELVELVTDDLTPAAEGALLAAFRTWLAE